MKQTKHREIILAGSGSQGLILSGIILAEAAMQEGKNVVQTQSYGPEARGGYSRSDVIIARRAVDYPQLIGLDLLVALFITRLAKDDAAKKRLQLLWLFNPAAIYVSSVMGQSDMMVVFFLLLSLIAAKEKRYETAALFAGLSALFKPAGLFLIPVVAVAALTVSLPKAVKSFLVGFGVYLLGILAYLPSISFRTYALLAEQTGKSTFAGITIASGTTIPWFFIAYTAILILLVKKRLSLFNGLALALAASLVFSHFHPQWFVWLTPWLIYQTLSGKIYLYWAAILAWLTILLSFDFSLHLASFWWLGLVPNQYLFSGNLLFSNLVLLARAFLIPVSFLL